MDSRREQLERRLTRLRGRQNPAMGLLDLIDGLERELATSYEAFDNEILAALDAEMREVGSKLAGVTPTGGLCSLAKLEESLAVLPFEAAVAAEGSGMVIVAKRGGERDVTFTNAELRRIRGCAVMTHSHPTSPSPCFSRTDIQFARQHNIQQMRLVTRTHLCTLHPPDKGWTVIDSRTLDRWLEWMANRSRERGSLKHEALEVLARETGMRYQREQRRPLGISEVSIHEDSVAACRWWQ